MRGFIEFVREQGVVGLAVGFILGGSITTLVKSFIQNIISPLLALGMKNMQNLTSAYVTIGTIRITWGAFISDLINFIVMAFIVYFGVKILKLNKLDKKKS